MRYTKNMEPSKSPIKANFSPEFMQALHDPEAARLNEYVGRFKSEHGPVAEWAEAIGTRLQIRDFLLQQKEGLAALHDNQHSDIRQAVNSYFAALDTSLAGLTGKDGKTAPVPPEELKALRIDRLAQEPAKRLGNILDMFSSQPSDQLLGADELVERTVDIRDGMVERLWSAAATYMEGDSQAAHLELATEADTINHELDQQISTVLQAPGGAA